MRREEMKQLLGETALLGGCWWSSRSSTAPRPWGSPGIFILYFLGFLLLSMFVSVLLPKRSPRPA